MVTDGIVPVLSMLAILVNTGNTAILANTVIAINTGGPAILASPGSVINPSASSASIVEAFLQPGAGLQMTGGPRTVSATGRRNWQECWETGNLGTT